MPSAGQNQKHLAKELFSTQDAASIASRTTQLVDINDSASVRSFALSVVSEAAAGSSSSAALLRRSRSTRRFDLVCETSVGRFRFDLNTPQSLLKDADAILAQLKDGHNDNEAGSASSPLSPPCVRHSVSTERASYCVPAACSSLEPVKGRDGQTHERRSAAPRLAEIYCGTRRRSKRQAVHFGFVLACSIRWPPPVGYFKRSEGGGRGATDDSLRHALASFDAAHPPPSSLAARSDRPGSVDPALLRFAPLGMPSSTAVSSSPEQASPSAPFALVPPTNAIHQHPLASAAHWRRRPLPHALHNHRHFHPIPLFDRRPGLSVSTQLFDKSTVASTAAKTSDSRLTSSPLSPPPPTRKSQTEFIEAACRLSSFKVKSIMRPDSRWSQGDSGDVG